MFDFIWDELPMWAFRILGVVILLAGAAALLVPIGDWWLEALR